MKQADRDRLSLMIVARNELQRFLSPADAEKWLEMSEGFLHGVNTTLRFLKLDETDLEHLLPSFSSDPNQITYAQVVGGSVE